MLRVEVAASQLPAEAIVSFTQPKHVHITADVSNTRTLVLRVILDTGNTRNGSIV